MVAESPKLVTTPHHHIWTDALHARALASQAKNQWDRGTYVRWTIATAWTVLEMACQDALEDKDISYSFQKNLKEVVSKKNLPPLDWGKGIWQKVINLQNNRKKYVHQFSAMKDDDLFPDESLADQAIETVREAVKAIYTHAGKSFPMWIEYDRDRGWDVGESGMFLCPTVLRAGAEKNNPNNNILIKFITKEKEEFQSEELAYDTDPEPYIREIINNVNIPITAIRVYQNSQLIREEKLRMRGI